MLRFKPYFRVHKTPEHLELMSEASYQQFPLSYEGIFDKLQSAEGLDPTSITSADEFSQLKALADIDAVVDKQQTNLENMLDFAGFPQNYIADQLKHVTLSIVNLHPDEYYFTSVVKRLQRLGVVFNDDKPRLTIYIATKLNAIRDAQLPSHVAQIGSYYLSISPLLNPLHPAESYYDFITECKGTFAEEGLQAVLPPMYKEVAISLLAHEIFNMVLRGGSHDSCTATVTWEMATLKRKVYGI